MMDFQCATHGLIRDIVVDVDLKADPVRSHPCPQCGELAPHVWTKAPGMQPNTTVAAVQFGGRLFKRDDIEEVLDNRDTPVGPLETPEYREKLRESFSRNIKKELAGELPRQELTSEQVAQIEGATASVSIDPQLVAANESTFLDAFRKTEFKE